MPIWGQIPVSLTSLRYTVLTLPEIRMQVPFLTGPTSAVSSSSSSVPASMSSSSSSSVSSVASSVVSSGSSSGSSST